MTECPDRECRNLEWKCADCGRGASQEEFGDQFIQNQWISVKDRLPEEGEMVLVTDGIKVVKGCISTKKISPHFYGGWIKLEPLTRFETHWMPLPEPPA